MHDGDRCDKDKYDTMGYINMVLTKSMTPQDGNMHKFAGPTAKGVSDPQPVFVDDLSLTTSASFGQ